MKPRWTKEEDIFLRKHYPTMPIDDILKQLDRTWCAIKGYAYKKRLRRKVYPNSRWSESDLQYLTANYAEGHRDDIINRLNRKWFAIRTMARRNGLHRIICEGSGNQYSQGRMTKPKINREHYKELLRIIEVE